MTQAHALDILKMGHNVFLTGSAGAGKTYVLNAYIKYLKEHRIEVAVTASTGIAATHMGGMTIHAWSGMGIRDQISDYDIDTMEEKKYLWDRYEKVRVLIIDEISMLSGTFLDNLDRLCRSFKRAPEKPFGGIQIVLCGDLFQLPPINKQGESSLVIDARAWKHMHLAMCYLTEQHRQDDDDFLNILNAIRSNTITEHHVGILESRIHEYDEDNFNTTTKLFTHNADVDTINAQELSKIDDAEEIFVMTSRGKENLVTNLKKSCLAPESLRLKIGAEVMFVKNNFEKGYVNGTRGRVVDFNEESMPIIETRDGERITVEPETWSIDDDSKVLASITQVPLRHAWAITVHKSQGMSLDSAVIDLSKSFSYGMGYVALSRVRTLEGVILLGLGEGALLVDPRILEVDKKLQELSDKASVRLQEIDPSLLKKSHEDFILRCGGTLEKTTLKKKDLKKNLGEPSLKNHELSYQLIKSGKAIADVAKELEFTFGTIVNHLEKCRDLGMDIHFKHIQIDPNDFKIIKEAFEHAPHVFTDAGVLKLAPIKSYLEKSGYDISFDQIRLAKMLLGK